jgi:mercuric ion transport protein
MEKPSDSYPTAPSRIDGLGPLLTGAMAALLASSCCLAPLVLLMLGVSGAWIGYLTALEPYQPYFVGAALVALFFAWRSIWRPASHCAPSQVCARPSIHLAYKLLFGGVVAMVLLALALPLIAPWFY